MRKTLTQGFTLVETLVYIFVFSLVVVVTTLGIIASLSTFVEVRANRDLLESGSVAMERITREVRNASSVNTGISTFDASPGVLSLTTDDEGTDVIRTFSISDGQVILTEDSALVGPLTDQVIVSSLTFSFITTAEGEAVRIILGLQSMGPSGRSVTFYDTVGLRGSY